MISILILTKNTDLPSYRYRMVPLIEHFPDDVAVNIIELDSKAYIFRLLAIAKALKTADIVIVQKLRLLPLETIILRRLSKYLVMDIDDAIYADQPKLGRGINQPSPSKLKKFNALASRCDLVIAGNAELSHWAKKTGARVEIFPTGVDVHNYQVLPKTEKKVVTAVWVGLPGNLKYLEFIRPLITAIQATHPEFQFTIISSHFPNWPEINVRQIKWSSTLEKTAIAEADIGIMPLSDDLFSRGKCAFKLLQYMSAGLPCIASPVGANCEVITPGENGFLASTPEEWDTALRQLISSSALRQKMSANSRQLVLASFNGKNIGQRLATRLLALRQESTQQIGK